MRSAADIICAELRERAAPDRSLFLRELLANAAAGLSLLEGEVRATETIYRLADAMIGHEARAD